MPTIRLNTDAVEALREFQRSTGRTLAHVNEVGHDAFEVEVTATNLARLAALAIPGETLSETLVRVIVSTQMKC